MNVGHGSFIRGDIGYGVDQLCQWDDDKCRDKALTKRIYCEKHYRLWQVIRKEREERIRALPWYLMLPSNEFKKQPRDCRSEYFVRPVKKSRPHQD